MTLPTRTDLARAICCPGACQAPAACAAEDTTRAHLVNIREAAARVSVLLCDKWRAYRATGPMTHQRIHGGDE